MNKLIKKGMEDYSARVKEIEHNREAYWAKMAKRFTWFKDWNKTFDDSNVYFPKWFIGGELNITYDALDVHVQKGRGEKTAFIFDSQFTREITKLTYRELLEKVSKLSGAFSQYGLKSGDYVLIYMPNTMQTFLSMLAAARLGAVYSILMGIQSEEIITGRIDELRPKVVVVANGEFDSTGTSTIFLKRIMDQAIRKAEHKPSVCFVHQRPCFEPSFMVAERDVDFETSLAEGKPRDAVPVEANSPCFVIYTSGTTGKPKGVVISVKSAAMSVIQHDGVFLGKEAEVCFIGSSLVWIAGQLGLGYMSLMQGVTTILFEGPILNLDCREIYRMIADYNVNCAFIATATLRVMKQQDPDGKIAERYKPFSGLTHGIMGGTAGELLTFTWAQNVFNTAFHQIYGLTELSGVQTVIGATDGGSVKQPLMSSGKPLPDWNIKILRPDMTEADTEEVGRIVVKLPLPPMSMTTIFNDDERYIESYLKLYPGYFDLKDDGKFDKNGFLYVLTRADSVFKAGGNRVSCIGMEEVMMSHPEVADCVVVTKIINNGGIPVEIPYGFFVVKDGCTKSTDVIGDELVRSIHTEIGSYVPFSKPFYVTALPRTVTGKVARGTVQNMVRSQQRTKEEIEDESLRELSNAVETIRG